MSRHNQLEKVWILLVTASYFTSILSEFSITEDFSEEYKTTEDPVKAAKRLNFDQETCQLDRVNGTSLGPFYPIDPFQKKNGFIELLVRMKGPSDGRVMLSVNTNSSAPFYLIILGSLENTQSEIRKSFKNPVFKLYTKGIMSMDMFRGFMIRYNEYAGELWVLAEGSEMPLLHWKDPTPIPIRYFSFSSLYHKEIQVVFNCKSFDKHEILHPTTVACQVRNLSDYDFKPCYKISNYFDKQNKIRVFLKFEGASDGHVRLEDGHGMGYEVVIGSFNNTNTEIRTMHDDGGRTHLKALRNTPHVLSSDVFRGFFLEYNRTGGILRVFEETSPQALVTWVDGKSLDLRYISFSAYHPDQIVHVAFNCTSTDNESSIYQPGL